MSRNKDVIIKETAEKVEQIESRVQRRHLSVLVFTLVACFVLIVIMANWARLNVIENIRYMAMISGSINQAEVEQIGSIYTRWLLFEVFTAIIFFSILFSFPWFGDRIEKSSVAQAFLYPRKVDLSLDQRFKSKASKGSKLFIIIMSPAIFVPVSIVAWLFITDNPILNNSTLLLYLIILPAISAGVLYMIYESSLLMRFARSLSLSNYRLARIRMVYRHAVMTFYIALMFSVTILGLQVIFASINWYHNNIFVPEIERVLVRQADAEIVLIYTDAGLTCTSDRSESGYIMEGSNNPMNLKEPLGFARNILMTFLAFITLIYVVIPLAILGLCISLLRRQRLKAVTMSPENSIFRN